MAGKSTRTNTKQQVSPPELRNLRSRWQESWSKTDLRARPIFHRTKDAIDAHLTIVFTALAVSRAVQSRTGLALRNVLKQLRPLRSATIAINGTTQTFAPVIPDEKQAILDAIQSPEPHALKE